MPGAKAPKCLPLYPSYIDFCNKKHTEPIADAAQVFERQSLLLHVDNLDPEELRVMCDFLSKSTVVEYVHIDVGKVPMKRALRQKLMRLGLEEPYAILPPGYSKIARSMSVMAAKATHLLSLHLIGVRLNEELTADLAKGLGHCKTIQSVDFEGSSMGDSGLDILEEALANRPSLCHVGLANCNLTDTSARPVARILRSQAARRDEMYWSMTLRGQTVPIRGEGCFLVNLATNSFGDAATDILCHALYNDSWLYGLNLNENKIGPRGVLNFAETLQTNTTLTILLLKDNSNTDNRVSTFINKILQERQTVTSPSMNHPMEHFLLKGVLRSWGCHRPSANDVIASIFTKIPTKPDLGHKSQMAISRGGLKTNGTKNSNTETAVQASKRVTNSTTFQVAPKKKVHAKSSKKETTKNALQKKKPTTPTVKSRSSVKTHENTSDDDMSALDMLMNDQMFRSNQEPTPAKRLDQQMLIKLMERISTLENAQAKAQEHIDRVEAENLSMKQKLNPLLPPPPPAAETEIISQLETAIVNLTEQVQDLERKQKVSAKPQQTKVLSDCTNSMLDDLASQLKISFGLDS
ncbi:unnamed protein product [Aphanomyces euteiches]|uniref:Uncharacterized protein n=1 Tax=Aphanomyces euteiches TaxID=100861 RepID=A0A6G0XRT5_9STRA|nr:hypothetical protein Ae201684_002118 [Aphanomyces euteiches]KAH9087494.1 hypothetical protein Ae201684P_000899 [Aphanomyces euteiches]KAH9145213.1 hypothetical protein AeRB84_010846 [Aphanomyces euteiches]